MAERQAKGTPGASDEKMDCVCITVDVSNVVRLCRDTDDRCQARQPVGELERQHDQQHQVHAMRHAWRPAGL